MRPERCEDVGIRLGKRCVVRCQMIRDQLGVEEQPGRRLPVEATAHDGSWPPRPFSPPARVACRLRGWSGTWAISSRQTVAPAGSTSVPPTRGAAGKRRANRCRPLIGGGQQQGIALGAAQGEHRHIQPPDPARQPQAADCSGKGTVAGVDDQLRGGDAGRPPCPNAWRRKPKSIAAKRLLVDSRVRREGGIQLQATQLGLDTGRPPADSFLPEVGGNEIPPVDRVEPVGHLHAIEHLQARDFLPSVICVSPLRSCTTMRSSSSRPASGNSTGRDKGA